MTPGSLYCALFRLDGVFPVFLAAGKLGQPHQAHG
jgi:hypothetical protein